MYAINHDIHLIMSNKHYIAGKIYDSTCLLLGIYILSINAVVLLEKRGLIMENNREEFKKQKKHS